MSEEKKVLLRMHDITKRFPGTLALDHVQLTCYAGHVHVLLGENGAGKSTLVKIISGVYARNEGTVEFEGREVNYTNVREAIGDGISMIHQELNLLPERTIAQNIYIGHEPVNRAGMIDYKKMTADSRQLLDDLGLDLDPNEYVKNLSIAQQQMVEVVKALSNQIKLLIMDEPTSSLTQKEITKLFEIIDRLKKNNVAIVYISHRMDEIKKVGDEVTIMRDGKYIATLDAKTMDMDEAISMMVGRKIDHLYARNYQRPGKEILRTSNLTGLRFRNVNITVHEGEIVSLSGLVGAGRTEIAKAEIYQLMDRLVSEGYGILMISSELSEVIGVSDRVYVMREGEIKAELSHDEMSQEAIMSWAIKGGEE